MLRLLECELRRQCSCHTLSNTNSSSNNCSCSILVDARIGIQSMKHITTTKKKQFGKWSAGRWKYKLSHRLHTHFIYHSLSMSKSAHNPQQSRSSHRPTHQLTTQHPTRHGPQISPMATSMHRLPRRLSLNNYSCSILEWICTISPLPRRENVGILIRKMMKPKLSPPIHPCRAHFTCATRVHITLNTQLNPEAPSSSHPRTLPERTLLLGK